MEPVSRAGSTRYSVPLAVSFAYLLNDMIQSVIVAVYPLLKDDFHLSFTQIGVITLTFQLTASLLLTHVGLTWTVALSVVVGPVVASAFPATTVYAQDMLTHRIGLVSGPCYGFSFGLGGIGAAVLGVSADHFGIVPVYQVCAFLPLLGLLAVFPRAGRPLATGAEMALEDLEAVDASVLPLQPYG